MPILTGDIKLLKSERLLDTPDGGGQVTGQVVLDGQSNNLFPDISELDRTYGRVSLRKAFVGVWTEGTDSYYGAHTIIAQAPADPRVAVTLFATGSWSDRRADAVSRMESYLAAGAMMPAQLYGNHLAGQRSLAYACEADVANPDVGETLVLSIEDGAGLGSKQYVRVARIISRTRTKFHDAVKGEDFYLDVVVAEITEALRSDFPSYHNGSIVRGGTPKPPEKLPSVIRRSVVADAARFYGITKLAEATAIGATALRAQSTLSQVVPAAQGEIPIVDASPWADREVMLALDTNWTVSAGSGLSLSPGTTKSLSAGRGLARGSVRVTVGSVVLEDDGRGALPASGGVSGTVDYASGTITLSSTTLSASSVTISAQPAVPLFAMPFTAGLRVAPQNRAATWVKTLSPAPAPGSVAVDFLVNGKWERLTDQGGGVLRGNEGAGSGTVNYLTGTVMVTLGRLPDVNAEIVFSWATLDVATIRTVSTQIQHLDRSPAAHTEAFALSEMNGAVSFTLAHAPIAPGSIAIEFDTAGEKTAQIRQVRVWDEGSGLLLRESFDAQGNSTFQTAGAVDYSSGSVTLTTRGDGVFYRQTAGSDSSSSSSGGSSSSSESSGSSAGSDSSRTYTPVTNWWGTSLQLTNLQSSKNRQSNTTVQTTEGSQYQSQVSQGTSYQTVPELLHLSGAVVVRYRDEGSAATAPQPSFWLPIMGAGERVLAHGVVIQIGNTRYFDRGDGVLYANVNPLTEAAVAAGTVNYTSGECVITTEPAGGIAANAAITGAVALSRSKFRDHHILLRIPGAPINPGSVQIRVTRYDTSATLILAPGLDGMIDDEVAKGSVDYQTGLCYLAFGSAVAWESLTDADRQAWWYSPTNYVLADPAGGDVPANRRIFKPVEVDASSLRVNAVAVTRIPLSSSVLGIDTVRLPPDGRVPIIAAGDVVVVQQTEQTVLPNPPQAGATVDLGRVRLASVHLLDSQQQRVAASQYLADLDSGTVTLAASLDLVSYPPPWVAEHRVEDMALVSDVQVDGTLTLTRPLTHAYSPDRAWVSSAVIIGDLQARAHTVYSQQTWTGSWSDSRSGAAIIAQFNDTLYPIVVSNRGAIEERWALIFTNATEFRVVGEAVGQIAVGNTTTACMPTNPATGVPYFSIDPLGWGAGWAAGNVLRFNTAGAGFPLWIARTVQQGPATHETDAFQIQIRGDIDR